MPRLAFLSLVLSIAMAPLCLGRNLDVSFQGSDKNDGSPSRPFRTISAAAQVAQPGDVITVHAGVYRERIDPPRGGASEQQRIVYQAAPGETVEIAGSEEVKDWTLVQGDIWKSTLPNALFGGFNPYREMIHGDWYAANSVQHNPGAVYLNGEPLLEAAKMEDVLKPMGKAPLWFAQVDGQHTTILAQFHGVKPNERKIEINVRQTVFYPRKTGINYLTVRGFTLRDAATPWAPPTAEQIGLIGTDWSKGWVIEDNVVKNSTCSGISLGKYGDQYDNTSANTANGYVQTIERAVQNGWSKDNIGHHLVRHNTITRCGQAGVVGSLGAVFSQVIGNDISDIANNGQLDGAEQAGIKFHAAVDVLIKGNRIRDCKRGLWMDWMAQGTRISGNLLYRNKLDLFMEVDHGPFLIDNNLLLSSQGIEDRSEGGAYVHNLIAGGIVTIPDGRTTPYFAAHSTKLAGTSKIEGGDDRFFNNLFVDPGDSSAKTNRVSKYGLAVYNASKFPPQAGGNIYYHGALPLNAETDAVKVDADPALDLREDGAHVYLQITLGHALSQAKTTLIRTKELGVARVPNLPFENPDGSPLQIDFDYFGGKRNPSLPTPGPFENPGADLKRIRVW